MPKYRRGGGSIYLRGKTWWLSLYVDGKHVCESTHTRNKSTARALLRAKVGQIEEGRFVIGADQVTFEELIKLVEDDYKANERKSLDKVTSRSKHLAKSFGGWRARAITAAEVRAFIARRKAEKASNGEINRELAILGRGFMLAVQTEKLARRPYMPRLEENNCRTGFFEKETFDAVARKLPEYLRPPMAFAYLTGWRKSEVLGLQWSRNIDFAAGQIRLESGTTKNKEGRVIEMTAALRRLLEQQWESTLALQRETQRMIPWVFHNASRRIVNYYKAWHRACEAAGVSGNVPHDFRRTAVRNFVRAGIPERVAMQMTGHKTRSVFDRYHIVAPSDLREAARKLDAAMAEETATNLATMAGPASPKQTKTPGNS